MIDALGVVRKHRNNSFYALSLDANVDSLLPDGWHETRLQYFFDSSAALNLGSVDYPFVDGIH